MTGYEDKEKFDRAVEMRPFGILVRAFEDYELSNAVEMALCREEGEKKMRKSEEQYHSLVEDLNAVFYTLDDKGIITYVNPSVKMYGGYTQTELVGRHFTEVIHPEDLPAMLRRFQEITSGKEMPIESRVISKTGRAYWMRFHGKAIFEDGRFAGVQGVLADVTEIRSTQETLEKLNRELEARVEERTAKLVEANKRLQDEIEKCRRKETDLLLLSHAVEHSDEGIGLLDLEAKVLYANRSFAESHGYIPEEMVGKHFSIFHNAKQMRQAENGFRQVLENGSFLGEIPQARRDGTVFPAMIHSSLIRGEDGIPIAVIMVVRDITEQKKIERQLFQSEKLASLGYLTSGIAHEINNPNNFITFNIPILRDYLNELMPIIDEYQTRHPDVEFFGMPYDDFREDVFRLLDNIQHGSDRITTTVSDLREFVRKKGRTGLRKVDLREIFRKTFTICKGNMNRMINSFEVESPEQELEICTDPESLELILINLLINAAQAADKKESWVKLSAASGKKPYDAVIIEVSDNGCGMDDRTMRMIFDPFFTTKGVGEGTGLGLSVCYRLVEQIGGHIEVESEVGKGSTFRVILPLGNWRNQG